jgi:4'-phosphopantetheinyl transferase
MNGLEPACLGVRVDAGVASLDAAVCRPEAGSARVWLVPLTRDADTLAALARLLSGEEHARAQTFRVDGARDQFVQARAMLRLVLEQCTGRPAAAIDLIYGRYGKPMPARPCGLHFNVAHSGGHALLGVGNGVELGVDIERVCASRDLAALSDRVLSPAEAARWRRLAHDERAAAFFSMWTAKEAVAKSVGLGLQLNFPGLDVGLDYLGKGPGVETVVACRAGTCRLTALPVPAGYAGALALASVGQQRADGPGHVGRRIGPEHGDVVAGNT